MKWLVLLVAGGVVAAVACGGSDDPSVVVPRYLGEPNRDSAALIGRLVVDGKCLFVEAAGGSRLLIGFPDEATKWDDDSQRLTLGDRTFAVGDEVMFGGSAATGDPLKLLRWATEPSPDCTAEQFWISQDSAKLASEVP
jgi:hypothetical protein